jgi:hypothetical protein
VKMGKSVGFKYGRPPPPRPAVASKNVQSIACNNSHYVSCDAAANNLTVYRPSGLCILFNST